MHRSGLLTPDNVSPHWNNSVPDHHLMNAVPLLLEGCCECCNVRSLRPDFDFWPLSPTFPKYSLWVKVRRHRWSFYPLYIVVLQEGCNDPGSVWTRIIIHEKKTVTHMVSHRQRNGSKNIFTVILRVHVALDDMQISSPSYENSMPNHYGSSTPPVNSDCKLRLYYIFVEQHVVHESEGQLLSVCSVQFGSW